MMCDECRQNPATVHLTRVINGKKSERHLCGNCARELGEFEFVIEPKFSIPNLLAGLMSGAQGFTPMQVPASVRCDLCGLTDSEFLRTGRLGCSQCYEVFEANLDPLVRRIHGATAHAGRVPRRHKRQTTPRELNKLRTELRACIEREDFEQAARIRDQIREMEQQPERGEGA